jgi:hypothetical protein
MGFWQLPESGKVSKAQVVRYPTLDAYRLHHSSPSLHELYQSEVLRFEASARKPTCCPQTAFQDVYSMLESYFLEHCHLLVVYLCV